MRRYLTAFLALFLTLGQLSAQEQRQVFLADQSGTRIKIADLAIQGDGTYQLAMQDTAFADHFLSMRPFKCLEGPQKTWCHVPYPYENMRNISGDLVDLEYDLLFLWKGATDYGINMWNGVYYRLEATDGRITGRLHELDMDLLAVPPEAGELRPLKAKHLHEGDPDSHWLPELIIE